MLIEVRIEHGFVHSVSTDEDCEHEVVVVMEDHVEKAIHTSFDPTIADRRKEAREQSQLFGIGTAYEIAADSLRELSRTTFSSPAEAMAVGHAAVQAMFDSFETVMGETCRRKPPHQAGSKRPAGESKATRARSASTKGAHSAGRGKRRSRRPSAAAGQLAVGVAS